MRLQLLTLRIDGEEVNLTFHWRLTLVTGVGAGERADMIDTLLGGMAGQHPEVACLYLVDAQGRAIRGCRDAGDLLHFEYQDGSPAPSPLAMTGVDHARLHQLALVRAEELLPPAPPAPAEEPVALIQARRTLAELDARLAGGHSDRIRLERLASEVAAIEEQISLVNDFHAHVRYVALLADLERVRAEAAALRGSVAARDADRQLLVAADTVRSLAATWAQSRDALDELRGQWGQCRRVDADDLAHDLTLPDQVPATLSSLAKEVETAEANCLHLESRLNETATAQLPQATNPVIVRLARLDQNALWSKAEAVLEAQHGVTAESVQLGGVETGMNEVAPAADIDDAHDAVDAATRRVAERRMPALIATTAGIALSALCLVFLHMPPALALASIASLGAVLWGIALPHLALRRALGREKAELAKVGLGSWLAYALRRMNALLEPGRRTTLDAAIAAQRLATEEWIEFVGGKLDVSEAIGLRADVSKAVNMLGASEQHQADVGDIHRRLREEAEPALAQAKAALAAACEPFGIDVHGHTPAHIVDEVQRQVERVHGARLQRSLLQAERAEKAAWGPLQAELHHLGFATDDGAAAFEAFAGAVAAAQGRQASREHGRPLSEVEAELTVLTDRSLREGCVEWGNTRSPVPPDGVVDLEELKREHRRAKTAYTKAHRAEPDTPGLQEERDALAERVAVLEANLPAVTRPADPRAAETNLLARVAAARRPGAKHGLVDEPIPLILDNPFTEIQGEDKWGLLDLVERLSADVQIIVLSDDPEMVVWAHRRVAVGAATLLETAEQNA